MRVILAPDSFKGSLTAAEAADAMAAGIARVNPAVEIDRCPISDGGEGFLDTLLAATGSQRLVATVTGPRGEPVEAAWGLIDAGATAVIEMAQAAGLELVPAAQRDPTQTTTYGVGELIAGAWDRGVDAVLVGLGGSATNDGGAGMAQALGYAFLDATGRVLPKPLRGGQLHKIAKIQCEPAHPGVMKNKVLVACDVNNPLTGPRGAATVYSPQKGATPVQVHGLDAGLANLARVMSQTFGRDFEFPGAGAAGGMGAGLRGFCQHSSLTPGIDLVLDSIGFNGRAARCDLCLTGEGRLDSQSLSGKAVVRVAKSAGDCGVPTIAFAGSATRDAENTLSHGLDAYHVIGDGHDESHSMRHAAALLTKCTERVIRKWVATRG